MNSTVSVKDSPVFDILLLSPHNITAFPWFQGGWLNKHCSSSRPIPLFIIVMLTSWFKQ